MAHHHVLFLCPLLSLVVSDSLCKSCRLKLGSTSFRAALHRLCDDATRPSKNRLLHTPAALQSAQTESAREQHEEPRQTRQNESAVTTPTPTVQSQVGSSARSARVQSDSPNTIAAKYSSHPPASHPHAAASAGESPSPPSFQPSHALTASARSSRPPAAAVSTPSVFDSVDSVSLAPLSKQEGVLTLRFHSAKTRPPHAHTTSNTPLHTDRLISTAASFTPATQPPSNAATPIITAATPPAAVAQVQLQTPLPTAADSTQPNPPSVADTYQSRLDQYLAGAMSKYATQNV